MAANTGLSSFVKKMFSHFQLGGPRVERLVQLTVKITVIFFDYILRHVINGDSYLSILIILCAIKSRAAFNQENTIFYTLNSKKTVVLNCFEVIYAAATVNIYLDPVNRRRKLS